MVKNGKGGAKTLTGLNFEKKVDLIDLLKGINGYNVHKSSKKAGLLLEHLKNMIFIIF